MATMKAGLLLLVICFLSSCSTTMVNNQKVMFDLSKRSVPNINELSGIVQPGQNVLIINTNNIQDGKTILTESLEPSIEIGSTHKSSQSKETYMASIEFPVSNILLVEDGIINELLSRKINVVDKIIYADWRKHLPLEKVEISEKTVVKEFEKWDGLSNEQHISGDLFDKIKSQYHCDKLVTFRILGYSPKVVTDSETFNAKIMYILRIVDANTGLIQYNNLIEREYNDGEEGIERLKNATIRPDLTSEAPVRNNTITCGIGVVLSGTVVRFVKPDSPASKAGIVEGDKIIEVDGQAIQDNETLLRNKLLGEAGTKVKVKIRKKREQAPESLTLERERI